MLLVGINQQALAGAGFSFCCIFGDTQHKLVLLGNFIRIIAAKINKKQFMLRLLRTAGQADGKAIVNGLVWRNQLVLVTETGVRTVNLSELK